MPMAPAEQVAVAVEVGATVTAVDQTTAHAAAVGAVADAVGRG